MPHFAGQVIRFERIELTPSTDASPIPDFRFVGVVVSEPTQPGIVITKTHLNDYQGVLRGGDAHHHTRDGNKYIYATQLPLAYFDDGSINQIQGDKVQRGILASLKWCAPLATERRHAPRGTCSATRLPILRDVLCFPAQQAQFSTALSRFTSPDGIHIVAMGRYAHWDNDQLEIHWEAIRRAIRVHPRALVFWNAIGELSADYAAELVAAQEEVAEIDARRTPLALRSNLASFAQRFSWPLEGTTSLFYPASCACSLYHIAMAHPLAGDAAHRAFNAHRGRQNNFARR